MKRKAIFFSFLQMERMKYPSKYIDKVRSHGLDGPALVFGDVDDLKDLLDMTFGEWATFRLHFLGLKPHHRAQNKKLVKKSAQTHFPPRFPPHVANQYSSNPCLATCSTWEFTSFQSKRLGIIPFMNIYFLDWNSLRILKHVSDFNLKKIHRQIPDDDQ